MRNFFSLSRFGGRFAAQAPARPKPELARLPGRQACGTMVGLYEPEKVDFNPTAPAGLLPHGGLRVSRFDPSMDSTAPRSLLREPAPPAPISDSLLAVLEPVAAPAAAPAEPVGATNTPAGFTRFGDKQPGPPRLAPSPSFSADSMRASPPFLFDSDVAAIVFGPTRQSPSQRWSCEQQLQAAQRLVDRLAALHSQAALKHWSHGIDSLIRFDLTGVAALLVCRRLWAIDPALARAMPTVALFITAVTRAEGYNMMLQPEPLRKLRIALIKSMGVEDVQA